MSSSELVDVGSAAPDPAELRAAFAQFPSGVAALSSVLDGACGPEPVVLVVSSFQVGISLDPPLVSFAVQRTSTSWPRLRSAATAGTRIGVSVLARGHERTARQLAARSGDRFAGVACSTAPTGAHYVDEAAVRLECSVFGEFPAGDHEVVLLRVHALEKFADVEPLVWHGSGFRALAPRSAS